MNTTKRMGIVKFLFHHKMEGLIIGMKLSILYENMSYTVKEGYSIILLGYIESNASNITLAGGEQFFVKDYTGYDIYGEDRVEYCGNTYVLNWDNNVLNALTLTVKG